MSDDVDATTDASSPAPPTPPAPPPPAPTKLPPESLPPDSGSPTVVAHPQPPRPGDLTVGWRTITAALWIGVVMALAAVWNASVQLGLSTWWLGPRSEPQPRFIQFSPFVVPVLMVLAAVNHLRRIAWFGMAAALVVIGVGVGDLDRVARLAAVEIAVGVVAFVLSAASLTGTYRAPGGSSTAR